MALNFTSTIPAERTAAWAQYLADAEACIASLRTMRNNEQPGTPRFDALLHAYLVVKADKCTAETLHQAALADQRRAEL